MSNEIKIPSDLLKEFLRSPRSDVRGRGELIYLKGNVLEVYYDKNTYKVHAQVQGSRIYNTSIKFSSSFAVILGAECNCPYGDTCKHSLALAYHLLNESNVRIISDGSDRQIKLAKTKASTFRVIPGNNLEEWRKNINYLRPYSVFPHRPSNLIKFKLEQDGMFVGEFYTKDWYNAPEEKNGEAVIQLKSKKLSIKCNSCSFNSEGLCKHQYIILDEMLSMDAVFENDYETIIENSAAEIGISPSNFIKYFKVSLVDKKFQIESTSPSILFDDNIEEIKESFSTHVDYKKLKAKLEGTTTMGEAFVWTEEEVGFETDVLLILSGKKNKDGSKLASNFKVSDRARLMPKAQFDFFNRYILLKKSFFNDDRKQDYLNIWELITESRETIKSSLNYYYKAKKDSRYFNDGGIFTARKSDLNPFDFRHEEISVTAIANKVDEFYQLEFKVKVGESEMPFTGDDIVTSFFLVKNQEGFFYNNSFVFKILKFIGDQPIKKFTPKDKHSYFEIINYLQDKVDLVNNLPVETNDVFVNKYKYNIKLKELGDFIIFEPIIAFDQGELNVLVEGTKFIDGIRYSFDETVITDFRNTFLNFNKNFIMESEGFPCVYLNKSDYLDQLWYLEFFEKCNDANISVIGHQDFQRLKLSEHKADIQEELASNIDWFDLNIIMKFGDEIIERKKWTKAIKDGQQYIELDDGSLGLLPEEWFNKLSSIIKVADTGKEGLRISKMRFNIIDELFDQIDNAEIIREIEEKKKALLEYKGKKSYIIPTTVNAEVRPYQQQGYDWLRFLENYKLGGILADDMGLGKTLQMISLLASAKQESKCFALIIVPNSLLFNWSRELDKFCPDLTYMIYHKLDRRSKLDDFEDFDVVITTYGTATKDAQLLNRFTFSHIILDESQAIKNPSSKRFKSLRLLRGKNKFCLTGTPIENNTFDLYAQMSFVNPGLLGNQTYFKINFSNPIDKAGDPEATKLLTKMVHPFLLRRTKDQVAKDLPDKVESVMYCEMHPHQRQMYDELKDQIRQDLMNKMNDEQGSLKFMVLDGLLRLRQLCNSPLLVDKNLTGSDANSSKIDALVYSLSEEIGDGNALVFSQFVQTLDLIKKALDQKGIKYAYLDGQTKKRDEVVDSFMNNDECKVFLLSLKAGNTGLNLTKAQYVYIFDPWWNPAVEAQAIDRTHRIGQNNKVFAYKLICKDTVEEKIVQLQKRKKKIASDIIKTDDAVFKSLNKDDLMALFE